MFLSRFGRITHCIAMKASPEKDKRKNPTLVRVPEHELPGRIMSPPPFELDASAAANNKRKEEEEEELEEAAEREKD